MLKMRPRGFLQQDPSSALQHVRAGRPDEVAIPDGHRLRGDGLGLGVLPGRHRQHALPGRKGAGMTMTTKLGNVIQGDCLEVMRGMATSASAWWSPRRPTTCATPTAAGWTTRAPPPSGLVFACRPTGGYDGYDDNRPEPRYQIRLWGVFEEVMRLLRSDGAPRDRRCWAGASTVAPRSTSTTTSTPGGNCSLSAPARS